MTMAQSVSNSVAAQFPLFEDGPFARVQVGLRLAGTEQRHVRRRLILAVLVTWVPLAILSAIEGQAIGPSMRESMLLDVAMYARYLVALPLLILSTPVCRRKIETIVRHFLDAGLVQGEGRGSFFASITATLRWRDSMVAAIAMVVFAIANIAAFGTVSVAQLPDSWRVTGMAGHRGLSMAGWWLVVVCEPLYRIVMLQLLYRLGLWWRFLWRVSRLELHLNAGHPDGAGGLGFLSMVLPAFRLPVFAIAASVAGGLANMVLWMGVSFVNYQYAIGAFAAALVALTAGPLVFFNGQLHRAKERDVLASGALAGRQLRAFEEKWLAAGPGAAGEILQTPDFSAICDLNSTVTGIGKMNTLPFWPKQLIPLAVAALLPFVPVAAIEMPLKEIVLQVWKLVK